MYKYGIIRHAEVCACILILIVFSALSSGCITESNEQNRENSSIAIIQTSGETVNLPSVANRIVLLNGNGAEILYLIGAGEKVVGVSNEIAVHPERGKLFPNAVNVGDWMTPNIELISELKPDVIIAFNSMKPKNLDLIEDTGIPVVYIDC